MWCYSVMFVEALQKKMVLKRACSAVHEGSLIECDVCGKHFRRRHNLGNHLDAVQEGVSSLV